MPALFAALICLITWVSATFFFGSNLVPSPLTTLLKLTSLIITTNFWTEVSITVFRGIIALAFAVSLALATGIIAGRHQLVMRMVSPLVAVLQATPSIIWITLLMVWAGSGSTVPIMVVTAALFPPLFANIAYSTAALPKRLFKMANLYQVGNYRILKDIILPGIFPFFLGGFSFAIGSCWKVAAVAEFLGSSRGIGAQIYWSYRMLDMPALFSWALVLIGIGVSIEWFMVRPLREIAGQGKGEHA